MDLFAKKGSTHKLNLARIENFGTKKIYFFADSERVLGLIMNEVWTLTSLSVSLLTERSGPNKTQYGSNTQFLFKDEAKDKGIAGKKEGTDFYLTSPHYKNTIWSISIYEISMSTNIRKSTTKKKISPKK